MIDLHAHVLPDIDDGPATMAESLALLQAMAAQGITRVVAGAHTLDGVYNATRESVLSATAAVNEAAQSAGLGITVLPGMELRLGFDILAAVKSGRAMGLNGSGYLLVELPAREFPLYTERALFDLMIAGYRPILNHPERNAAIVAKPELMHRLADRGVVAAITAASLLGRFGSRTQQVAEQFIDDGVATLVVSDSHNTQGRAPMLAEGLAAAKRLGKENQAAEAAIIA